MASPQFHALTTVSKGGRLNVLKNECEISAAWAPGSPGSQPPLQKFEAIWDTGATNSVVTQRVIDACNLAPTGMAKVSGVHGQQLAETYLVNIALPNKVIFHSVRVTKGRMRDGDVLIGMDIIGIGDFSVTNSGGITKFSYRTPSIEHIDYVEQAKAVLQAQQPPRSRAERRRAKLGRT